MRLAKTARVWVGFAVCAACVLGGMAWLSHRVVKAEQRRIEAEQARDAAEIRADVEERTRLALWRMDASGAAVMLRENRRAVDESSAPSVFPRDVLLRFEVGKEGRFDFSNTDELRVTSEVLEERISRFQKLLDAHPLPGGDWQLLNSAAVTGQSNWNVAREQQSVAEPAVESSPQPLRQASQDLQIANNAVERSKRARVIEQALDAYAPSPKQQIPREELAEGKVTSSQEVENPPARNEPASASATPMLAVWLGEELFLLRQIYGTSGVERVQGVWMDWREMAAHLLGQIQDLMPGAKLVPASGDTSGDPLTLVSFPLRLVRSDNVGALPQPKQARIGMPLRIAWLGVFLALVAAGILIAGILRLSDRRASFVSAVTHELRTPLTTFRLYSDLLEKGVIQGEKRQSYLRVLTREADRLSHMVENVLAFSRIESGRSDEHVSEASVNSFLEGLRERFTERLASAGLAFEMDPADPDFQVRLNLPAVEHILFNLIDNAAKYAAGSAPNQVCISCRRIASAGFEICVMDFGPGIPSKESRRIFKPFHKSANQAAESCPGVGLGLALSQRLARGMGAQLELRNPGSGACFVLIFPPEVLVAGTK